MIRPISTSFIAACACATVIAAQTPAGPAPIQPPQIISPQTPDPGVRSPAGTTITVEGCVQRNALAQSAVPGATATAGSTASTFILADAAKPVADAASGGTPPILTSTYRLDGAENELNLQIGHRVEIVGTVDAMAASAAGKAGQAPATSVANAPRLKVDTVRMLASICTPAF